MIAVFVLGTLGGVVLLVGLTLLFRKPVGTTLPPRGPAVATIGVGIVVVAISLWGAKNPRQLGRFLQPGELGRCPILLTPEQLATLASERSTAFSGHKVEGGWCEYNFEFRSGRKLKGKLELDLSLRQEEWVQTCGNHPLTQDRPEAWLKKLENDAQLLCFLTTTVQGAIWLDKDDDGLKWQRALQSRLPMVLAVD